MLKKVIFVSLVVVLVSGIGLQYWGQARKRKDLSIPDLETLLPKEIPGWVIEDRPVADSPEMLKTVEKVLSYDSAIFRIYRKQNLEISIYAAYWLPSKVPINQVDAHTPDVCWVVNGWKMEKRPPLEDIRTKYGVLSIPNVRNFNVSGHTLSVLYWHAVGSKIRINNSISEAELGVVQRARKRMAQFYNIIIEPPGEQFFIRISSNQNITEDLSLPPVEACLDLVGAIVNGNGFSM